MSLSFFSRFRRARRGNVAVMMALSVLPILVVVGLSLDAARQVHTKKRLRHAVDAAVHAGAYNFARHTDVNRAKRVATRSFDGNVSDIAGDTQCDINSMYADRPEKSFKMTAQCTLPTTFGIGISGQSEMSVRVTSKAKDSTTSLDLALVLDISGSMDAVKIAALQTAAKDLVDQLITAEDDVRIALVPYQNAVNPGTYGFEVLGYDDSDSDAVVDPEGDGRDLICLTERLGDEAFTDAEPGVGAYAGTPNSFSNNCETAEVMPLTSDADALKTHIDAMDPTTSIGGTAGHVGVGWGWYTISPEWSDVWPSTAKPMDYGNPDELKVVVIMTDGTFNQWNFSAPTPRVEGPDQARNLCTAMKAKGVIIYTIAFDATTDAESLMQDCASSTGRHYFEADDADALRNAYAKIAKRFQGTALMQ